MPLTALRNCGRIRDLEGDVHGPSSSSVLARALAPGVEREGNGSSLDECLADLRRSFGYQGESTKRIGAVKVEAAYVDIPSSGSDVKRQPLRKYLDEGLNQEFNHPERISEELATPTGTIKYNESNESMKNISAQKIEESQVAMDTLQRLRAIGARWSVRALGLQYWL